MKAPSLYRSSSLSKIDGKTNERRESCSWYCFDFMNYSADPLYACPNAIKNLNLEFVDGFWWRNGRKCVPNDIQNNLIEIMFRAKYNGKSLYNFISQEYWWPHMKYQIISYLPKPGQLAFGNRLEIQMLSYVLNKFIRYPTLVERMTKKNTRRLQKIMELNGEYQKEANLIEKLIKTHPHMHVIALEYEIDDGGHSKQQQGDVILSHDKTLYIVECKSINTFDERRIKVREQAMLCRKRILSWIKHLSEFDECFKNLLSYELIPAIYTDESDTLIVLEFEEL